jgi:hypothetical protein
MKATSRTLASNMVCEICSGFVIQVLDRWMGRRDSLYFYKTTETNALDNNSDDCDLSIVSVESSFTSSDFTVRRSNTTNKVRRVAVSPQRRAHVDSHQQSPEERRQTIDAFLTQNGVSFTADDVTALELLIRLPLASDFLEIITTLSSLERLPIDLSSIGDEKWNQFYETFHPKTENSVDSSLTNASAGSARIFERSHRL